MDSATEMWYCFVKVGRHQGGNAVSNEIVFRSGDSVTWVGSSRSLMSMWYGDGPFPVVSVEEVPKRECSCGAVADDPHFVDCAREQPNSAGHSQWAILRLSDEDDAHMFSAAHLKMAQAA